MCAALQHITVCICTYKRSQLIARTLEALQDQEMSVEVSYSIVVVDNDASRSAQATVSEFSDRGSVPIKYVVEPQKNIALARNKALENADGDFVVFIDDDEFPSQRWLLNLLETCRKYKVDGVLGPVVPDFESQPPEWILKGAFFERPNYETGRKLAWRETRTGNVLLHKSVLADKDARFNPIFDTGGEDVDFFRRMTERGHAFVWCKEAPVYEVVPASRCKLSYLLKRALLRGSNFPKHRKNRLENILKSLIAVPAYTLMLPVLVVFGCHKAVSYLVKLCDHVGRLLAFVGVNLVTQREM